MPQDVKAHDAHIRNLRPTHNEANPSGARKEWNNNFHQRSQEALNNNTNAANIAHEKWLAKRRLKKSKSSSTNRYYYNSVRSKRLAAEQVDQFASVKSRHQYVSTHSAFDRAVNTHVPLPTQRRRTTPTNTHKSMTLEEHTRYAERLMYCQRRTPSTMGHFLQTTTPTTPPTPTPITITIPISTPAPLHTAVAASTTNTQSPQISQAEADSLRNRISNLEQIKGEEIQAMALLMAQQILNQHQPKSSMRPPETMSVDTVLPSPSPAAPPRPVAAVPPPLPAAADDAPVPPPPSSQPPLPPLPEARERSSPLLIPSEVSTSESMNIKKLEEAKAIQKLLDEYRADSKRLEKQVDSLVAIVNQQQQQQWQQQQQYQQQPQPQKQQGQKQWFQQQQQQQRQNVWWLDDSQQAYSTAATTQQRRPPRREPPTGGAALSQQNDRDRAKQALREMREMVV